jgi:hypothetical protein
MIVHKLDENKPLCFSDQVADQVADQVVAAMYHISQASSTSNLMHVIHQKSNVSMNILFR